MGCYGIGVSRLMGVIAEHFSDEKGLVWPEAVAPYHVYLVSVGNDVNVTKACEELCETLQSWGCTVLYDDRDARPGEKFADADLLGIPHRVVVSSKTLDAGKYEYKQRSSQEIKLVKEEDLKQLLTK